MDAVRVVEMTGTDPLRSQTIYHAVARTLDDDAPDTLLLVTPGAPYVSTGFHQDAEVEVDLDACQRLGLPVVRREVGGGAVYLDSGQVFCQWVIRSGRLPAALADRFRLFAEPLVATYRAFGVPAEYRPVNDIHVRGRKIGGTGAARIEEADVMVGSLMFEFQPDLMARVLRVMSEKMRDKVASSLREYVTSLSRELDPPPARSAVVARYLDECARTLGRPFQAGTLRAEEIECAERLDRTMGSTAWTLHRQHRAVAGVRIHQDVHVYEGVTKAPGGLVRATLVSRSGRIEDLSFSGDFTMLPREALGELTAAARGMPVDDPAELTRVLHATFDRLNVDAPGLPPTELVAAIQAGLTIPAPPPA
ncbi:MAG: lipoate--protein ligase family protein [Streptosporangiaceae bacterium]